MFSSSVVVLVETIDLWVKNVPKERSAHLLSAAAAAVLLLLCSVLCVVLCCLWWKVRSRREEETEPAHDNEKTQTYFSLWDKPADFLSDVQHTLGSPLFVGTNTIRSKTLTRNDESSGHTLSFARENVHSKESKTGL